MQDERIAITAFREGEEGVIHAVNGGRGLTSRLAGMGVAQGARVRVTHNSGGWVILQVSDTRVALGRGEAAKILAAKLREAPEAPAPRRASRGLTVALAGQPNVGKSTLFNILTGLSQHVGNWPGKTVEKKEGTHATEAFEMRIVDLPGTYSLTASSEEERVARDFIIDVHPDVIILIVSAAALERGLYLLSEILLLESPVIVAVNMLDVAEAQGIEVDPQALERALGVPVVPMVATKNRGIRELVARLTALAEGKEQGHPRIPAIHPDHEEIYRKIAAAIDPYVEHPYTVRWTATKLMEGDPEVTKIMEGVIPEAVWNPIQALLVRHEDSLHAVVAGRYEWIESVTRAAVSRHRLGEVLTTDRIDHVLTRPLFGIPILFAILALVFAFTYRVGFPLQAWLERLIGSAAGVLRPALAPLPDWLGGVLIDGVVGGVGSVLTFLPILIIFFAVMAFLEDVGYMARASFVMDRFMHLIGLHGKSFLPLCLGFGCNVPSVMGARIVEAKKERLLTIFLAPFIPCTARLAVITLVTGAMFGSQAISWATGLLALNLLLLGVTGMVISRFFLKGEATPFIMELPLYHRPDIRTIGTVVWMRTAAFVRKAGTIILAVSVAVWLFSYLPYGQVETSLLAGFGRLLEPLGRPLGLDWKMVTALLTSIVAKENAVATLGVLYAVGDQGLVAMLPRIISHASAAAFLVVLMLFIPCAATVAVMRRELADNRWFAASLAFMFALSYAGGVIAYRLVLLTGV
ncbi:MAG TPA: ferrous iron transport protein B [Syntrophales bacterium]|nr:ferrous iron transport protein B [Syntrophales bacterium]